MSAEAAMEDIALAKKLFETWALHANAIENAHVAADLQSMHTMLKTWNTATFEQKETWLVIARKAKELLTPVAIPG
ncbi:MAG: hypothetical protein WC869_08080 [Phycisphaerae bacterium]|jgi:hypothetical protein